MNKTKRALLCLICLFSGGVLLAQSLPNLSVNLSWTNRQQIISGSDQKPDTSPAVGGVNGVVEPGAIIASNFIYAYVLVFIANEGRFFSTSTNLTTWSSPVQFFTAPNDESTQGLPADENVILVTPGNPVQGIGQTGIVLYAHTPVCGGVLHELTPRPFTFVKNT